MRKSILFFTIAAALSAAPTRAQNFGITARVGSMGLGAEVVRSFSPAFNARLGLNYFKIGLDGVEGEELKYDMEVKMNTVSLLVDWFPGSGAFRISAGAIYNNNQADIDLSSAKSYTISGKTYSPEELGIVNGKITFPSISPYVGIGLGNPVTHSKKFSIGFDVGLVYQSSPQLAMKASGPISPTAEQQPLIEENIKWAKWLPNVSVLFSWGF